MPQFEDDDQPELIFSYSRSQAIDDGVLVEVPQDELQAAGIRYHTCLTAELWHSVIVPDEASAKTGSTAIGRLRIVLALFARAANQCKGDLLFFDVVLSFAGEPRSVKVKSVCGPGDDPTPCITLMCEHED